LITSSMK